MVRSACFVFKGGCVALVTVVAKRQFTHEGAVIHRGEGVTVEAMEAAALAQQGHVTLDRSVRATYRTTDMVATPVLEVVSPSATPVGQGSPFVQPTETAIAPRRRRGRPRRVPA